MAKIVLSSHKVASLSVVYRDFMDESKSDNALLKELVPYAGDELHLKNFTFSKSETEEIVNLTKAKKLIFEG